MILPPQMSVNRRPGRLRGKRSLPLKAPQECACRLLSHGQQGDGGSKQQDVPAAISKLDQQAEIDKDAEKAHALDLLQEEIEIKGRAASEIERVRFQEHLRGSASFGM